MNKSVLSPVWLCPFLEIPKSQSESTVEQTILAAKVIKNEKKHVALHTPHLK